MGFEEEGGVFVFGEEKDDGWFGYMLIVGDDKLCDDEYNI